MPNREVGGYTFNWYGTMNDFDYVTAFMALCLPGWRGLPADVRDLVMDVVACSGRLSQQDLCLVWTEEPTLRQRFDNVPSEVLCQAARVVHFFGHWFSPPILGEDEDPPWWVVLGRALQDQGGYWKFSSLCDEVLRQKVGLEKRPEYVGRTCRFEVHEGMLRLCYSSWDAWAWQEAGLATLSSLERGRRLIRQKVVSDQAEGPKAGDTERYLQSFSLYKQACELLRSDNMKSSFVERWLSTDKYKFGALSAQKGDR